jgi:hypothetical protein
MEKVDIKEQFRRDIIRLGLSAPAYKGAERVDELRAYLRLYLEPYLRGLRDMGIIKQFLIGISETFFYAPQLKVRFSNGDKLIMPLTPSYSIKSAGVMGRI